MACQFIDPRAQVRVELRWQSPAFFDVKEYDRPCDKPFLLGIPGCFSRIRNPVLLRIRLRG
jgi:hypothetical protein